MRIFTSKSIWKKVVIALLIVLLFQVVVMKPVHADVVEFGGKLMSPILSLLVSLGDGINDIIGRTVMGSQSTLYEVNMTSHWWEVLSAVLVAIVVAALVIIAIVATAGLAAVALAAVGITATVTIGMGTIIAGVGVGTLAAVWYSDTAFPEDLYLPMYTYSAEEIFKGNILLFDVNFFEQSPEIKEKKDDEGKVVYYYYIDEDGNEVKTSNQNSAVILKNAISSWYNALRNICLVLMLSVLVYIGIRILLSSVASDKAKYLTMLKDWFIGLCLLFLMHYIMAFSVTLVERLTGVVKTAVDENAYAVVMESNDKLEKAIKEMQQEEAIQNGYVTWPTNLMGSLRLQLQMETYGAQYIGLCICFLILCLFTLYFTIVYLKRVLYMAFLTLIAPLVALTYCIDKLNDGKAQGFDKWFKEYVFNLLVQPMHLLLYYILVTSAFELASTNVIYSIVALGFMIPAEKLLRSLFGFEKAHTPPALGPAGAMMASSALNHLLHKKSKKGEGKDGKSDEDDYGKIPIHNNDNPINAFLGDSNGQPTTSASSGENTPAPTNAGGQAPEGEGTQTPHWSPDLSPEQMENLETGGAPQPVPQPGGTPQPVPQPEGTPQPEPQQTGSTDSGFTREARGPRATKPYVVPTPSDSSTKPKTGAGRRIKRMAHASWAAQKAAMRAAPRKFKRKLENAHPIRTVGKIATGAAIGTAAGAAGLAIAASTGDLGNVVKIGGGSAAAGFALGSGMAQNRKSSMDDKAVKEVYEEAYNKGEYKQDAMNDYVKNYLKDVKNRNYFEQKFGAEKAKEMTRRGGVIEQCLNGEITDRKEIAAVQKLTDEGRSVEQAIAVAQLGQMIGDNTNHMTTKRRNEWMTRLGDMAGESGVQDTVAFAKQRLAEIDKFNDFKK